MNVDEGTANDTMLPSGRDRHVAVVASSFPELSETFVVDHVKGLIEKGWHVSLVANHVDREASCTLFPDEAGPLSIYALPTLSTASPASLSRYARYAFEGLKHHDSPRSLHARLLAVRAQRLRDTLKKVRFDLVHAHFGPNGIAAAIALQHLPKKPLIVNFHGYDVTSFTRLHGWGLYRDLFDKATLIAHSDFVAKQILENMYCSPIRVTMGVDLERFRPEKERKNFWPRPLNLLSVGRLELIKGHHLAIRALSILRRRLPQFDARLRIVGRGAQHASLRKLIRHLGLSDVVSGPAPANYQEMPDIMNKADVMLICSQNGVDGWQEAFSRVAIEAMACGLPVVVTSNGGLPDTVGNAGHVAHRQDEEAIADTIVQLLQDRTPATCKQVALSVARNYSLARMIDEYDNISSVSLERVLSC